MLDCHLFADESRVLVVEACVLDCHLFADESRVLVVEVGVLDCHLFADDSRVLVVEVGVLDCHLFADESRVLVVEVGVLDCHLFADESRVLVVEVGVLYRLEALGSDHLLQTPLVTLQDLVEDDWLEERQRLASRLNTTAIVSLHAHEWRHPYTDVTSLSNS